MEETSNQLSTMHNKVVPNIFMKILSIMGELDYIEKGDKTVNGQYRFVSHDQVTEKIHHLLVRYKVTPVPSVKEIRQDNNRTVVTLTVTFVNAECPSDMFAVEFPGYGIDNGDKGPGKAISYAYKYAILKTFNIATGDDPDKNPNASYEVPKCLEFDSYIPIDYTEADKKKLKKWLSYCAAVWEKDIEDVKREAVQRPEIFFQKCREWNPSKKEAT